jgi:hypothetical protein
LEHGIGVLAFIGVGGLDGGIELGQGELGSWEIITIHTYLLSVCTYAEPSELCALFRWEMPPLAFRCFVIPVFLYESEEITASTLVREMLCFVDRFVEEYRVVNEADMPSKIT